MYWQGGTRLTETKTITIPVWFYWMIVVVIVGNLIQVVFDLIEWLV